MEEEDMASWRWKDRRKVARMEEGCSWLFEGCACGQAALPKDSRLPSTTFRLISALPLSFYLKPHSSDGEERSRHRYIEKSWLEQWTSCSLAYPLSNIELVWTLLTPWETLVNRKSDTSNLRLATWSPPPLSNKCSDFTQEGFTAAFHFQENSW